MERLKIEYYAIEDMVPNDWNPKVLDDKNEKIYRRLKEQLKHNGLVAPIIVRKKEDKLEIIDGYHRWLAAKELGYKEIPVINLGKIEDREAKALTIILEKHRIPIDEIELSKLLLDIGNSVEELEGLLFLDKKELEGLLALQDWDLEAIEEEYQFSNQIKDNSNKDCIIEDLEICKQIKKLLNKISKKELLDKLKELEKDV